MRHTAVIIARFQTPYLHEGHLELLSQVKSAHNKVVIVLGVTPVKGSRRNPFDYHTREKMLKATEPDLVVLPLGDHPSDAQWSRNLDTLLRDTFPNETFLLYGSRDSFIASYSGQLEVTELPKKGDFNATEIRELYADKVGDSKDFRAGVLYALNNQYPRVMATVDIMLFRNNRSEILLAQKANNPLWRFVGGFSDPTDPNFETAAKRELMEECGPLETGDFHYEVSAHIPDWRYKDEIDQIISTAFSTDLVYGEPKADDDISAVQWFPVKKVPELFDQGLTTPEHRTLFEHVVQKYCS